MNLLSFSHGNRHVNCKTSRSLWVIEIYCFCLLKRETLSAVSIAIIDKKNDITKNKTQNIIMKNLICLSTRPSFSILHVWLYPSFSTAYIGTHAHLLPYMFVHEFASAFFSCMSWAPTSNLFLLYVSDHEYALVFFHFACLIVSAHWSFSIIICVWLWASYRLFPFHMSGYEQSSSISCVWPQAHICPSLPSYVWPQACTCIFLLHMSDRKRAPVFFYFICLTANAHLYFSTSYVWPQARTCIFPLRVSEHGRAPISFYYSTVLFLLSDQEAALAFFLLYVSDHEPVPVFFHWCLIVRLTMHDWSFVRLFQFHIFDCEFASIFFYCTHIWACIHLFSIHFKGWPLIF